ncbi:MAG: MlaD family protein [Verrucomicrobiota bacterium]|nr:MlaD family protein [Verrucomicrobiota bacterium]
MSQSANYFKIGLFVIIAVIMLIILLILAGAGFFQPPARLIETYIDGSVQGLTVGAPVKFRGVIIGKVSDITFSTSVYEDNVPAMDRKNYVIVLMRVQKSAMEEFGDPRIQANFDQEIKRGLRVRQQTAGLTGVSSMEIDYLDPKTNKMIPFSWKPDEFYIPSAPSDISRLLKAAEEVFKKLERIDVDAVVVQATNLLVELNQSTAMLGSTINTVDSMLSSGQVNIQVSLENVRAITDNVRDLSETLKRDPSQIIFSSPPPPASAVNPPKKKKK